MTFPKRQPSSPAWQAALVLPPGSAFIQNSMVKSPPTSAGTCGSTGTLTRSTSPPAVPWKRSEKPRLPLAAAAAAAFAAAVMLLVPEAVEEVVEPVLSVELPLPVVTVADDGLVGL